MMTGVRERRWLGVAALVLLAVVLPRAAWAHIGSKDVFEQVQAGPYQLFVTIRTPLVIPGVATVEVRSAGAPVSAIEAAPVPLTGEAAKHPPTPDALQRSAEDPAFFSGSLWLMAAGSWQVRLTVDGAAGKATTGVPVAAMPISVMRMQRPLGILLGVLGLLLVLGMTGIVGAAVREARLTPGMTPPENRRRRALIASGATLVLLAAAVALGNRWWNVEAASYAADIYHPADLRAKLQGDTLELEIGHYGKDKSWDADSPSELVLDHEHIMHLYAIREPQMDAAFHLHPVPVPGTDELAEKLPAMPPGTYRLYADVVHHNGFPETLTTTVTIPQGLAAVPLSPEDASAAPPPLSAGELGSAYKLPDGYTMVWQRPAVIEANRGYLFRFELLDPQGKPAQDMQPYLGMAGHAAWVKADGSTFAHTHPEGSAAMPAMQMAEEANGAGTAMDGMAGMPGMGRPLSSTVEFPYGFPSPGRYRVFIQMKHGGTVETGVFDAEVK